MSRFLFVANIIIIAIYSSNIYASNQPPANAEYEYFKPLAPAKKPNYNQIANPNQYHGDHSKQWYKKNDKKRPWYINFGLNNALFKNVNNVKVKKLSYPDAQLVLNEGSFNGQYSLNRKGSLGIDLALGYQKNKNLRFELELSHFKANIKSAILPNAGVIDSEDKSFAETDFSITPLTLSILFNINNAGSFTPYIGAGFGYGMVGVSKEYEFNPVQQLKLGFNYKLNKKMRINISYRTISLGTISYLLPLNSPKISEANKKYSKSEYTIEHDEDFHVLSLGYQFLF